MDFSQIVSHICKCKCLHDVSDSVLSDSRNVYSRHVWWMSMYIGYGWSICLLHHPKIKISLVKSLLNLLILILKVFSFFTDYYIGFVGLVNASWTLCIMNLRTSSILVSGFIFAYQILHVVSLSNQWVTSDNLFFLIQSYQSVSLSQCFHSL